MRTLTLLVVCQLHVAACFEDNCGTPELWQLVSGQYSSLGSEQNFTAFPHPPYTEKTLVLDLDAGTVTISYQIDQSCVGGFYDGNECDRQIQCEDIDGDEDGTCEGTPVVEVWTIGEIQTKEF